MPALSFRFLIVVFCLVCCYRVSATHVVGGEVTYKFLGNVPGGSNYRINLTIYEDCLNGSAGAIAADSLALITVNDGAGQFVAFDTVPYTTTGIVPVNFTDLCVSNIPATCLRRKDYFLDVVLPPNTSGYTVNYRRCCRNAAIVNILEPANIGATYFCAIPPVSLAQSNNSAVFNNFPPQVICVNSPLVYDNSATDPDGDSLSYELCTSLMCPNGSNIEDIPFVPPYVPVSYVPPFTYLTPLTAYPIFAIDPVTGFISGTPTGTGRFLISVCCNEWRNSVLINTIKREFQFVITNCAKNVVANMPVLASYPNTFELNCKDHTIHFINTSTGGFAWLWDFGVPGAPRDTAFEPTFIYPDTGTFSVKLVANPGQKCADSVIRLVRIYPVFHARFAANDTQCAGASVSFTDQTTDSTNTTYGQCWFFGDGGSSLLPNPTHTYALPGQYDVLLACRNKRDCIDTAVRQVIVDNFKPFAGNDTTIVKGEEIQFHATGGISYRWSPPVYLESTDVRDPTGYFPDTGRFDYNVHIVSPFGCVGNDTIRVTVAEHGALAVPTAFTPNGDGHNDVFKPYAIGYRSLNYFRVFNRWGEEVFFTTSFEDGWDGTYHKKPAGLGTYFWEISYTDRLGKTGITKGDVQLLR